MVMPTAMMPPKMPPAGGQEVHQENWFDLLRELRAELQDFQALMVSLRKGQLALPMFAEYVKQTNQDITWLLEKITDGDQIRHIKNLWEQMICNPLLANPTTPLDAQDQLHYLDMLDEQIGKLVFIIGCLTIPDRVNEWLAVDRPGYFIPFHLVFEDELPDLKERQQVLNYMAYEPKVLKNGLVDAANGLIYRYSGSRLHRWSSLLWIVLGLALAVGIVLGSAFLPIANWPLSQANLPVLLIGWFCLLAGVVVHIAIGTIKTSQSRGGLPTVMALGDILPWVDSRVGQVLLKLFLALIGFFGLVFSSGIANVTLLNAFLVGYTLDSFVELFGASLGQQANNQLTLLKQQLGVV